MSTTNYLLLKGRAGLGNRMLALVTALLYARVSGRRLAVDWSDPTYSDDRSNVFPGYFDCPASVPLDELPATDSVAPRVWRDRLGLGVGELDRDVREQSTIDIGQTDYEEELVVLWLHTTRVELLRRAYQPVLPGFPDGSADEIMRELLRTELSPAAEIRGRVERFRRDRLAGRVVGVHIRCSDRRVHVDRILATLEDLHAREPQSSIFLATDNSEIRARVERRYRDVLSTDHWYPSPGSHIHQNDECPNRFENGIEALVDLYLLAGCDSLICDSTSSFARVAILLSRAEPGQVLDVKPRRYVRPFRSLPTRMRMRLEEIQRGLAAAR